MIRHGSYRQIAAFTIIYAAMVLVFGIFNIAHAQTVGGACSPAGSMAHGILISGRYTDLICDGTTYQEKRSISTGSSTTPATTLFKLDTDAGSCTAAKIGRMKYEAVTDTVCICGGAGWTKMGGGGSGCAGSDPYLSSTVLLLKTNGVNGGQNNTILDSSPTGYTVTRYGNATQGKFSPFTNAGGSLYFDGSGDYTETAYNANLNLNISNYTLEAWVYLTQQPAVVDGVNQATIAVFGASGIVGNGWQLVLQTTGANRIVLGRPGTGMGYYANYTFNLNTWYHVAFVNNAGTKSIYINGQSQTVTTLGGSSDVLAANAGSILRTGALLLYGGYDLYFPGYISNLRMSNNVRYTANFTPSTSPLTTDANTLYLLSGNNASVYDAMRKSDIETISSAQASTTVTKFSDASVKFNGTSDYLSLPSTTNFGFGTGDYTIEYFVYPTSFSTSGTMLDFRVSTPNEFSFSDYFNTSGKYLIWMNGSNLFTSSATFAINTWYHIAISRASGVLRVFVNGQLDGSVSDTSNLGTARPLRLGTNITNANYLPGYIYDLRLTKGVARYTAAFTPPSTAFTAY